MAYTIRFDRVSKLYKLGLTRTSLPTLISRNFRHMMGHGAQEATDQDFWALKDVSFELEKGESLALVGRNGAGKTTALKLLANITKPTSGSIQTIGQLSALIELGAGFHPDLTGRENIYLNGAILGLRRKEIDHRFDEIVDFSELEQFIDTPIKRYSSGMTVRLGFAVASCMNPDILLVDEVLAVGDAAFQQKCLARIRSLLDKGTSIIFVSHNIYLVQAVCEKALYLDQGKMRLIGPTKEVIDVYEQDLHKERAQRFIDLEQDDFDNDYEKPIEITRVEVARPKARADDEVIRSHESVQIHVHYTAYRSLGKTQASIFITRSDGLTCCMLRTKLDDFELDIQRGNGVLTVTVEPLQLVSGSYFVEAWFLNESDSLGITTSPARSDWFNVKGTALSYTDHSGVFEPHAYWRHASSNGHHSMLNRTPKTVENIFKEK